MTRLLTELIEGFNEARNIGFSRASKKLIDKKRKEKATLKNTLESSARNFGQGIYAGITLTIGTYDFIRYGPRNPETGIRRYKPNQEKEYN